jgi:phage terminase small subunit
MTPKQERFVEEYLIDLNATQAAIRAGYSPKTADQQGSRMLKNVKVLEAIQVAKGKLSEKAELTAEWTTDHLMAEAVYKGFGASHSARVAALVALGKRLPNFFAPERHQHGGDSESPPLKMEHSGNAITLLPADILAAARLMGVEGGNVLADGGPKPVDTRSGETT